MRKSNFVLILTNILSHLCFWHKSIAKVDDFTEKLPDGRNRLEMSLRVTLGVGREAGSASLSITLLVF